MFSECGKATCLTLVFSVQDTIATASFHSHVMRKGVCHRILFFYMSELLLSFSPPPRRRRTITTKMVGYYSHERRTENHSSSCLAVGREMDKKLIKMSSGKPNVGQKKCNSVSPECVSTISVWASHSKNGKNVTSLSGKRKCVYRISQKKMQKKPAYFAYKCETKTLA